MNIIEIIINFFFVNNRIFLEPEQPTKPENPIIGKEDGKHDIMIRVFFYFFYKNA